MNRANVRKSQCRFTREKRYGMTFGFETSHRREIEWHKVRPGLWIITAHHPDYLSGRYASNERLARCEARLIEKELAEEVIHVQAIWPYVEAQLNTMLNA